MSGDNVEEVEEIGEFELVDYVEGVVFQCPACMSKFDTSHEWNQHAMECHNISPVSKNGVGKFDCSRCEATFTRKNNLLRHFRKFHGDVAPPFRRITYIAGYYLECPVCEGKFTRKSNLLRHIRRFHEHLVPAVMSQSPKVYACPECNTGFTKWNNCKRHIKHFHSFENGCLKNPIKRHFELEPQSDEPCTVLSVDDSSGMEASPIFSCSDCDLSFTTSQGLTRHTELVHPVAAMNSSRSKSSDIKQCPLCSFCDSKLNLYVHFTSVHEQPILIECHDFETLDEFEEWRAQVESETDARFIGAIERLRAGETSRAVLMCSYSIAVGGNEQPNGFCPAEITVVMTPGKCLIYFVKTHVGHAECDRSYAAATLIKVENDDGDDFPSELMTHTDDGASDAGNDCCEFVMESEVDNHKRDVEGDSVSGVSAIAVSN